MTAQAPANSHDLPAHVAWLAALPGADLRQTHISYVVLVGDEVYKLKKPVRFDFIDLHNLEARKHACEEEVRLNSRLCLDLYYGVTPVCTAGGAYNLTGKGEVVDYAVHMRRLSADDMLDALVARDAVSIDILGAIAGRMATFHGSAATSAEITAAGGLGTLEANWQQNFEAVVGLDEAILPSEVLERTKAFVAAEFDRLSARLQAREDEGRIRDCHGDLRADAIWVDPAEAGNICIFDCLEFNERYRFSDIGLDIAFLAMDLDAQGRRDLSDLFVGLYVAAAGDAELPALLAFYKCYRAFVRGKVRSLAATQPEMPAVEREKAATEARHLFRLAASYAAPPTPPILIVVCGLSGSGKSVLAGALSSRLGAPLLSTDVTRKQLQGAAPGESLASAFGEGSYSASATEAVYEALLQRARGLIEDGDTVVLDATFSKREQRSAARALAVSLGVEALFVECRAPDDVIKERQEARRTQSWTASDASWQIFLAQRDAAEPLDELPPERHLVVDSTQSVSAQLAAVEGAFAKGGG